MKSSDGFLITFEEAGCCDLNQTVFLLNIDNCGQRNRLFNSILIIVKREHKAMSADLEACLPASQKRVLNLTNLRNYCARVRDVVDSFGFEEKRLAVEALRIKVYFTRGKFRLDVPIEVRNAIGAEMLPKEPVEVLQTGISLIGCTRTHGLSPLG